MQQPVDQAKYNGLNEMSVQANLKAKDQLNFYQIFWCDANIENKENQYYVKGFKELGFLNVQQFKSTEELMFKIDQRRTQRTIILLTSGALCREISKEIQNPEKPLRRGKVLDHMVFCGWYDKHKDFILENKLSLEPRKEKLSIEFKKLEQMIINSIKEICRIQALEEESNSAVIQNLNVVPEADSLQELIPDTVDNSESLLIPISLLDNMDDDADAGGMPEVEEFKNEDPKTVIFGKDMPDLKCNINIFSAIKNHKLLRNNEPFWPFKMDNDMHLKEMTFEEAKKLTNGLCAGLEAACKKIIEEMNTAFANPNAPGLSYIAKKQVAEWQDQGHDAAKVEQLCADILKKAMKASKQLQKNCKEELHKTNDDGETVFNWQRLPVLAIKLYTQGTWLTWRCEEMMWSPFDQNTSNHLGLWQGVIQGLVYQGVVERPDEHNQVSLSTWIIPEKLFDCVYKTMYITPELLQNLQDIANGEGDEEAKTIKIQGIFTCAINLEISLDKGRGIQSGQKVLFKIRMNSQYNKGDAWTDDRQLENQTGMLLGTGLQKDNCHIAIFYEPEMTINQVQHNAADDIYTVEMQFVPSDMKKMDW